MTLREEYRLRVLRRLFGLKGDEVTGRWIKLHNEELHGVCSSPSIIRTIKSRRMRHVSRMGDKRNTYELLVGKPERRRPLGKLRRRWLDNIRMDLLELGWGDVDWIGLTQGRNRWRRALVNSILNLRVSIKCWETIECLDNWWPLE
jgi:hypothetical protein